MNLDILKRLSAQQLKQLRDAVNQELYKKVDFSIKSGRFGSFVCSDGIVRHVRVVRSNPKSITVTETLNSHKPNAQWRIAPSMLSMEGVEIETTERTSVVRKPTTKQASPW